MNMENSQLVKINPEEFGLNQKDVVTIEQAFAPKIIERDEYSKVYESLITKELTPQLCNEAKQLRLKLVKVRTGISDIHKTQKAFFLAAGRFVDAWKNKETAPVEQMEEKLSDIEKYYERIEAERISKLESERKSEISAYSDVIPVGLGNMHENVYSNYLSDLKIAYEARIKAEQEAEAERLRLIEVEKENARLKAIEDERIRKENERLKAEAEAKEKQLQEERAKAESERKAIEEKAQKERESSEAEQRRLLQIEREKQAKLEAELKAKKDAEIAAQKEAERIAAEKKAAEEKAAKAPLKTKMNIWVDSFSIPDFENNPTSEEIKAKFDAFKIWAKKQVESI